MGPEKIGDKGRYSCYHGFVFDTRTNRREFYLPCIPDDYFQYPKQWPECAQPKFCLGPAKKSQNGLKQPFPIRDVPILSQLKYQCEDNLNKSISASCFLDGVYR